MLTETGRVVAVEDGALWVETIRQSTCGSCSAQKACGHGLMNKMADGRRAYIRVLVGDCDVSDCRVDDQVAFSVPENVILRGSFVVYLMPLLTMLAGAAGLAQVLPHWGDGAAAVGAIGGLVLGFALVRLHAALTRGNTDYQPVLVEVVQRAELPVRLA